MVKGLDKFREAFSQYSDNFVIIGGTACNEVLSDTEMRPRATMDIDIVVIVEKMTKEFATAFWTFIQDGGYRPGIRKNSDSTIKYVLYSFDDGKAGYPIKIELLSHHNEIFSAATHIEPLPIEDNVSSLSAIILDEPYLNLLAEKTNGRQVNSKDILKHRNDVLKLTATMPLGKPTEVDAEIAETIATFVNKLKTTLPNQSLEDALRVNSETIGIYLDTLSSFYTTRI